ncbi:MAG TPA: DUF2378 family protein [Polyangiales bacterium]
MPRRLRNFVDPPWSAPLDANRVLRAIPESATIVGMFCDAVVEASKKKGLRLPSARDKYTHYKFYPLKEHAQLLVEACPLLYPGMSLRQALRKLGRAAPQAMLGSTIGKVMLGAASGSGLEEALHAWAKSYPLHLRPGIVDVKEIAKNHAIVRMEEIHYFLDSHHVGAFEGLFSMLDLRATVKLDVRDATSADLLCTWP